MSNISFEKVLDTHRSLLLSMEAIGWLHMAEKTHPDFLRHQAGVENGYDYKQWYKQANFEWNEYFQSIKTSYESEIPFPESMDDFIISHKKKGPGILGLLQAAHGVVSGVEKNLSNETSEYLKQSESHMWLSTSYGYPVRNLLSDCPSVLKEEEWPKLIKSVDKCLSELKTLNESDTEVKEWWDWREKAIGSDGFLRKAFTETLAETRLPNNDVTLWDQSYVTAALFKSALAGALLHREFPWKDKRLKDKIRWSLLSVGIGADNYEMRSVRIGDLIGSKHEINTFFEKVREFIEVNLAVGAMLYKDDSVIVFSFPELNTNVSHDSEDSQNFYAYIKKTIDAYAQESNFETPPHCIISPSSRSLLNLAQQLKDIRKKLAIPVHRNWEIAENNVLKGHICPVCQVRFNGNPNDKQKTCSICSKRRTGRLEGWQIGELGSDSIWLSEVADENDRLAVITMSFDLDSWLDGSHFDSLRSQSAFEWVSKSQKKAITKDIKRDKPLLDLQTYIKKQLEKAEKQNFCINENDTIMNTLNGGFKCSEDWKTFFEKMVEDRASSPEWKKLTNEGRAKWLTHQLLRKNASPGRMYRVQRQTEEFFKNLLEKLRQVVDSNPNQWCTKRLILKVKDGQWEDKQTYSGHYNDAPVSLLYRNQSNDFITICNMGRLLENQHPKEILINKRIELKNDESKDIISIEIESIPYEAEKYSPIIPLEIDPRRFRVVVPLSKANECIKVAIEMWKEQYSKVWDRMPLRIGAVAFSRMMPYQAVIEAVRNLEKELVQRQQETWSVMNKDLCQGVLCLSIKSPEGEESLRTTPVKLPDGQLDVFYTYCEVEETKVRYPRDFQYPEGKIYRHMCDLCIGDGIYIKPAVIGTVFMESAASRFDNIFVYNLDDWQKMTDLWHVLERLAPSQTALRGVWDIICEHKERWQGQNHGWKDGEEKTWLAFVRSIVYDRFDAEPASLEYLVNTVNTGLFDRCMDWHIRVLKMKITEE